MFVLYSLNLECLKEIKQTNMPCLQSYLFYKQTNISHPVIDVNVFSPVKNQLKNWLGKAGGENLNNNVYTLISIKAVFLFIVCFEWGEKKDYLFFLFNY